MLGAQTIHHAQTRRAKLCLVQILNTEKKRMGNLESSEKSTSLILPGPRRIDNMYPLEVDRSESSWCAIGHGPFPKAHHRIEYRAEFDDILQHDSEQPA